MVNPHFLLLFSNISELQLQMPITLRIQDRALLPSQEGEVVVYVAEAVGPWARCTRNPDIGATALKIFDNTNVPLHYNYN